jgi:hypothetical protein
MPEAEHPIDIYITHLGRRLHLLVAERDQVLAEVRGHLEERARALQETGVSGEQAERQAVQAFGPVGRISRELRASHPRVWGKRRWIVGVITGAAAIWVLSGVGTVPFAVYYFYFSAYSHPSPPFVPLMILWNALPIRDVPFIGLQDYAYSTLGYPLGLVWMLPFFVLYPILPFVWGRRAQQWWVPGLAYGLGTGLYVVLVYFEQMVVNLPQYEYGGNLGGIILSWLLSQAGLIVVSLTLALAASFIGWLWRERSTAAFGRAQAA